MTEKEPDWYTSNSLCVRARSYGSRRLLDTRWAVPRLANHFLGGRPQSQQPMNAQGQVWFGDNRTAVAVQDRPDEIERAIHSARTSEGSGFITLRAGADGETLRVNPAHIRRIAGPPTEPAAASGTRDHPWR